MGPLAVLLLGVLTICYTNVAAQAEQAQYAPEGQLLRVGMALSERCIATPHTMVQRCIEALEQHCLDEQGKLKHWRCLGDHFHGDTTHSPLAHLPKQCEELKALQKPGVYYQEVLSYLTYATLETLANATGRISLATANSSVPSEVTDLWNSSDFVMVDQKTQWDAWYKHTQKLTQVTGTFALVESLDSGTWNLQQAAKVCQQTAHFAGVFKHSILSPSWLQNVPYERAQLRTVHMYALLQPSAFTRLSVSEAPLRLPQTCLDKIKPLVPLIYRYRYPGVCGSDSLSFYNLGLYYYDYVPPLLKDRPVDVMFFAHTMTYVGKTTVELGNHRKNALAHVKALQEHHPHLNVEVVKGTHTYAEFNAKLLTAKVVVSPWGYGEFSGKDIESLIAGAMVVKEDVPNLETGIINVYDYFARVRSDYSNFEGVVLAVLNNPDAYQARIAHFKASLMSKTKTFTAAAVEMAKYIESLP